MLVDRGLLQKSDLLFGGNSGSRNNRPEDFDFFFRAEYLCALNAGVSLGILPTTIYCSRL